MTKTATQQRILGRVLASECIDLIDESLQGKSKEFLEGFAREMKRRFFPEDEIQATATMSYEEAIEFEKKAIGFGKYEGEQYGEIPISYLTWLADQDCELEEYLRSEVGQARVQDWDDEEDYGFDPF